MADGIAFAPGELREGRLAMAAAARDKAEPLSVAQRFALLDAPERERCLESLSALDAARLLYDWRFWARPTQLQPEDPDWVIWIILCGRGWGKTRTGAEWFRERVETGECRSGALIGPSLGDVWKTMVEGSEDAPGLVDVFPPHQRPEVRRTDREIIFHNGAKARVYTAEEPELRGPNIDTAWCDELAKWRYLRTIWDNLEMAVRAKRRRPPRICITTTPRPLELIMELLDDPDVRVTFGSTFANAANVSPSYIRRMKRKYSGSRLGLQEIYGIVLGDNPDALFHASAIDNARIEPHELPELKRIVVAVDPAISATKRSDLTGIVVVGIGFDGEIYVLADLTAVAFDRTKPGLHLLRTEEPRKHSPDEWGELVLRAMWHYEADAIVAEVNRGGDLVAANVRAALYRLRGPSAAVKIENVRATRGKVIRAEPVAALWEQGRAHHVGQLVELEAEITEWNPKITPVSPNRLDALVWAVYALAGLGDEPTAPPPDHGGLFELNKRLKEEPARALGPLRSRGSRERLIKEIMRIYPNTQRTAA